MPPKQGDKIFYGHATLLKENGIYILETMNTGPLVAQGVNEFMFVLGQARIKGAVQMKRGVIGGRALRSVAHSMEACGDRRRR